MPRAIGIYPSGDRAVVDLTVDAKFPTSWFNTSGHVYLFAKPVVAEPTMVYLTDIGFARKLDNEFWNLATAVFEKQIVTALTEASHYDLSNDILAAKSTIERTLKDSSATSGINISLTDVSMGLGRVAVAKQELVVEGRLSAKATITAGSK